MKNKKDVTRTMIEIGLFAAIGFILDEIQGAYSVSFTSGGSIGIAMIAVLIVAYRRGFLPALLTGLIIGLMDFCTKAYAVHPAQVFLDYIFPYAFVGIAGLFKPLFDKSDNKNIKIWMLVLGTIAGGLLKFGSHFLAGIFFWGDPNYFAWNLNYMNPVLYSFVYNIAYIGPSIVICSALITVLFIRSPKILMTEGTIATYVESTEQKKKKTQYIIEIIILVTGLSLFVIFFIKYINSYYWKESSQKFTFNKDCMVTWLIGLMLILLSINTFIMTRKNQFNFLNLFLSLSIICFVSTGYSFARILEMYLDEWTEINNWYWLWFSLSLLANSGFITLLILTKKNKKAISANL